MKKIKRILTGVLATLVVGSCVSLVPVSADVVYDNVQTVESSGVKEYYLPEDFNIQSVLDDENLTLVLNGKSYQLYYVTVSRKTNWMEGDKTYYVVDGALQTIEEDANDIESIIYMFTENGDKSNLWCYSSADNVLEYATPNGSSEPNTPTVGESSGNPNTEFTVGDSTFPRGDINLDGKVNTVDLLMLKKYLLGLMEW